MITHPDGNELREYINDVSLLLLSNLGETRQSKCFFRSALSFRKLAVTVAQIGKTFLEVKGNWIIHFTPDPILRQMLNHRISLVSRTDYVLMKYVSYR